jgi:hypothetical protein
MTELQETLNMISAGTPAVHLCGDDHVQIDSFVTHLAEAINYEVLE